MKKIISVMLVVIIAVGLVGCKKAKEVDVKTQDLINSIGESIAKDANVASKEELGWNEVDLLRENGSAILEMMNLDPNLLEEAIYYENPMNVRADRIIIAKVKEEKDVNTVKLAFDELKQAQEADWKQYLPDQYQKVKEGQVIVKDKFVFYFVYDDIASIKKIVDDALIQ